MMLRRYEINVVRYARVKERDPGPGCPPALEKQDLFINSTSVRPQYPVENVQPWDGRTSRGFPQHGHPAGESDTRIMAS